uniref:Uncharacterized protein n=2 Tax=Cyprinus carpio TaxID=7962 RepID=A0A9J7XHR8_CYPCA
MMSSIIPKSKAKGTDICAFNNYYYIIRSDLGRYMQTSDLNKGSDISIFSLHPACQNGDHYIGGDSYFHIIKGDSCRRVTNLSTDKDAIDFSLHHKCRGGDHYFASVGYFYIIFQEKGTYIKTTSMYENSDPREHSLDPDFKNGLYYWGPPHCKQTSDCFNFLKPDISVSENAEFCTGPDLSKNKHTAVDSVHPNVFNFLIGGLSVNKGPGTGMWEKIKRCFLCHYCITNKELLQN